MTTIKSEASEIKDHAKGDVSRKRKRENKEVSKIDLHMVYDFVLDAKGSLARQCKINLCTKKDKLFYKRSIFKDHLLREHGLDVELPYGQSNIKSGEARLHTVSAYEARRKDARFADADRKFAKNRKKFEKYTWERAYRLYDKHPLKNSPRDTWVADFVKRNMEEYDGSKENRMWSIKKHIDDIRSKDGDILSTENSPVESKPKGNNDLSSVITPNSRNVVDISSSESLGSPKIPTHEVLVLNGKVLRLNQRIPGKGFRRVHVFSDRLSMSKEVTMEFVQQICTKDREVDTLLFSFFILWMEFSTTIDIATKFAILDPWWGTMLEKLDNFTCNVDPLIHILFLPIVHDGHWSLFVVFNCENHQIAQYGQRKGCVYMDSVNHLYTPEIHGCYMKVVKKIWASHVTTQAEILREAPLSIKVPHQPNSIDCGFYLMFMIRSLVGSRLQGLYEPNTFTKEWFNHEDVVMLRTQLQKWIAAVVQS